jgi:hypothetical protein
MISTILRFFNSFRLVQLTSAYLVDDSDTFVPQDAPLSHCLDVTFHDVQIRSTNRRLRDLDDGIRWCLDDGRGPFF